MKYRRVLALTLCGSMLLTGCSSLLQREYSSVTLHSAAPTTESDQLTIRVESYQDLVNVLLYFITQGREAGVIRLYNYPYDVEKDLEAACQEVTTEDPLGAYTVEDISYDVIPIVSCYEANLRITYRRTQEQVAALIPVTGVTAIRGQLQNALASFQPELALRISYFDGDEGYIRALLKEAYLASPGTAVAFPSTTVTFYPEGSRQCIAEIALDYQLKPSELNQRKQALDQRSTQLAEILQDIPGEKGLLSIRSAILETADYSSDGGSTAYHALVEQQADSLGLALSMSLLCQKLGFSCQVVNGSLGGVPHYWNIVYTGTGYRHLDLTQSLVAAEDSPLRSDRYMAETGYLWDTLTFPACEEPPVPEPESQTESAPS